MQGPQVRFGVALLVLLALLFVTFPSLPSDESVQQAYKRSAGNSTAAGDLYGLGVRVGLYLQTLGILLCLLSVEIDEKQEKGAGMKLAISANMLAILFSMVTLIHRQSISPCEAWLVITLVQQLVYAALAALCNPHTVVGEGIGIFAFCVANIAFATVDLDFWATSYRELPLLGTPNLSWIYTSVVLDHWFRKLMLATAVLNMVGTISISLLVLPLMKIAWNAWWNGAEAKVEDLDWLKWVRRFVVIFIAFPTWVMTIAGTEEIIKINGLTPQTDLSQPGQSIPFAIGIIVAVDGLAAVLKPGR